MRVKSLWLRHSLCLWVIFLGLALSLGPAPAGADHEVHEAQQLIEASLKKTFDDFNKGDYTAFADGWTDVGFLNKQMFRMDVDRPFPKDEIPVFANAMKYRGPIQLLNISNIRVLDHMMVTATAEVDLRQGNVRELYGLQIIKRIGLDKRYKIAKDELLPLRPKGFPVVEVKMKDFKFELDKKKLAKNMVLQLVNAGEVNHEFIFFQKVMPADWERSLARGAWSLKPGQTNELVLAGLEPGNYVMVCCNTQPGNEPHCAKGMRTEFTLK